MTLSRFAHLVPNKNKIERVSRLLRKSFLVIFCLKSHSVLQVIQGLHVNKEREMRMGGGGGGGGANIHTPEKIYNYGR